MKKLLTDNPFKTGLIIGAAVVGVACFVLALIF